MEISKHNVYVLTILSFPVRANRMNAQHYMCVLLPGTICMTRAQLFWLDYIYKFYGKDRAIENGLYLKPIYFITPYWVGNLNIELNNYALLNSYIPRKTFL